MLLSPEAPIVRLLALLSKTKLALNLDSFPAAVGSSDIVENSAADHTYQTSARIRKRASLLRGKNVEKTEADLKRLYPAELWRDLHLQFIYYGRECCPARGHDREQCEICREVGVKSRM